MSASIRTSSAFINGDVERADVSSYVNRHGKAMSAKRVSSLAYRRSKASTEARKVAPVTIIRPNAQEVVEVVDAKVFRAQRAAAAAGERLDAYESGTESITPAKEALHAFSQGSTYVATTNEVSQEDVNESVALPTAFYVVNKKVAQAMNGERVYPRKGSAWGVFASHIAAEAFIEARKLHLVATIIEA